MSLRSHRIKTFCRCLITVACCVLQAGAQPGQRHQQTVLLLREMVAGLGRGYSADGMLARLNKIDTTFKRCKAEAGNADSSFAFDRRASGNLPAITISYFRKEQDAAGGRIDVLWHVNTGYSVRSGKVIFQPGVLFAITLNDLCTMFGRPVADPGNKARKERNRYTFTYHQPGAGTMVRIEATTVFAENASANSLSTITISVNE